MFSTLTILLFTFAFLTSTASQIQTEPSQIIQVFRHGARGPLSGYDKTWHNHEFGALTAAGTRQHYVLGRALAKKYPKFFSKGYNPFQVYVLSDTSIRCVQSAQAQLDGIFDHQGLSLRDNFAPEVAVPPFVDPVVQETVSNIHFQSALPSSRVPVMINIVDGTNSAIFQRNRGHVCPSNHHWEKENAYDETTREAWYNIFKPTIDKVNSYLEPRHRMHNNVDVAIFGDALLVDVYDNRTLPGGMNDSDLLANFTSAFSWFVFHVEYGQLLQRQLAAYHTVEAMLNQLIAFQKGVSYHQVAMFSGHDYNLYALLAAFGIVTEECLLENFYSYAANKTTPNPACVFPHFAANIILEFYNHTNQVKFLYNNMVIPICNGKETCDYEEFLLVARNATGNNTLTSFREKCHVESFDNSPTISQEDLLRQSQEAESELFITQGGPMFITEDSEAIKQKIIASATTSSNFLLWIGLVCMTGLCLLLTANLISTRRANATLSEETKKRKIIVDVDKQMEKAQGEEIPTISSPASFTDIRLCIKS